MRVERKNRAVSGIDAAPSLFILVLFVADGDAELRVSKVFANEFNEAAGAGLPIDIDQLPSLEQIPRQIQGRPGRTVGGSIVIFKKLREETAAAAGVGNLKLLDPTP